MTKTTCAILLLLLTSLVVTSVAQRDDIDTNESGRLRRQRRGLICFGIFRDCDDSDNDNEEGEDSNSTDVGAGAGSEELDSDDWCLGLFRDCGSSNNNNNDGSPTNCSEATNGIFGGRPLFGECGVINEILFGSDNGVLNGTDTDGDGFYDEFYFGSNSSDKGPFGFGLLPESGFLYEIFNTDDDKTIIEALVNVFDEGTDGFAFGFIEDWSESAVTTNQTCVNADNAPACFDATGNDGFWVCRTLTDPYTAQPSSKSVCIGAGAFLDGNDACGCCPSTTNGTSAASTCPDQCPCVCDRDGVGDGVWIMTDLNVLNIENTTDLNIQNCVDPRLAISATNGFGSISCVEECPADE